MRVAILMVASAIGASTFSLAHDALALGPLDVEVALRGGVGTAPGGETPNPLGFGIGGRAGVAILGLYGGLSIIDYLGSSQDTPLGSESHHSLLYGVEAGYGMSLLGLVTIRGQVGLGNFTETREIGSLSHSNSNLYVEPGLLVMVGIGPVFVGADANVLVLPSRTQNDGTSSTDAAFTVHAQLGLRF